MRFSEISRSRLSTCHQDLVLVANTAIVNSPYDFKITHGHRSIAVQQDLFNRGRGYVNGKFVIINRKDIVTYCDGINKKSKHNYNPSFAFDIVVLINGKISWGMKYYRDVANHILNVAEELLNDGRISHNITWGGNFKMVDGCHFEI